VFVEPYAHLCHLGRKVSLGRQLHDNRLHLALQPQWPEARHTADKREEAAPGWGTSPTPLPLGFARHPQPDPSQYTPSVKETSALRATTQPSAPHAGRFSSRLLRAHFGEVLGALLQLDF
jgi:hypothetical protein